MSASSKFQIFLGADRQFYFRLRAAGNSEIILSSTEGYTTKANCIKGIESVKTHSQYDSQYIKKETNTVQGWRYFFVLVSFNNEPIGKSEMYNSEYSRDLGITSVKRNAALAIIEDLVPHQSYAG